MNARCYKTVFSKRLGARVAVGEHASSQGKATGDSAAGYSPCSDAWVGSFWGTLSSTVALVALVWATPAWAQPAVNALPTGGQVVQGAVQFNQSAQQLNIQQSTDRAAVNWQSFDIGSQAKVQVHQPSAQSVLLNRVGGESPSQIFGQLTANGQVILVNPNGMVFGRDGSVSAAGFTGSTLNISDADFMAGKERYTRSGTAASTSAIVNRGLIQAAPGGYVALLGASVSNEGRIEAPQGNVFMAAADAVTLPTPTVALPIGQSGRIKLELTPASINAAVANQKGGTIVTEGGQVYLQAAALNQAMATVLQSGSIDTTGEQGGQVHVLADGGRIRVDGQIKANSSNGTAGGDIYIGRDKDSNVLAAVGDASGAKLESKGGFVETSGQFLATNGTRVTAKDWLLDPSDITISSAADSNVSGTSPLDITPTGGDGSASVVSVATIQSAINAGTSVTIKTTNGNNTTGAGNITIVHALAFANNSNDHATLSLIADNGIIQNTGATITTNTVTGKIGLVHINMEAKGNYQGFETPSQNSDGININAGISTNGNITLKGSTSKDNNEGVYIGGVTLKAQNIDITGTSTGAGVRGSIEHTKGIRSFGTLDATDSITLKGTSTNVTGVGLEGGSVTAGGAVLIEGKATSGIYQGTNIGFNVTGASVKITGETRDNLGVAIGANVTATNGNVVIDGTSVNSRGVGIANGRIVRSNSADVFITGKSVVSDGINVGNQGAAQIIAAKNITLTGEGGTGGVRTWAASLLTAGSSAVPGDIKITGSATTGNGVIFQQWISSARLRASNEIDINGTVTGGAGSGSGVQTLTSEENGQSVMFNAGGKFTLTATNSNALNTNRAIDGQDGMQVTADGDISINAVRQTFIGNAIYFYSQNTPTSGVGGNASFKSTAGDVLIQANQGGIIFQNGYTGTPSSPYTSSTDIRGRNITIDNTGGTVTVDTATGKATLAVGDDGTSTTNGINLASGAGIKLEAAQNINLAGKSSGGVGVLFNTGTAKGIEVKAVGDVNIQGTTTSAGTQQGVFLSSVSSVEGKNVGIEGTAFNGNGVLSYAAITATTGGSATITGTSTGTGGSASALSLWANVTAHQNVTLKGKNTNTGNTPAAVFTNKTITATNGKIDVTAITNGTSENALQLHNGASLTAKTEINLKADTLSISSNNLNPATINAGTAAEPGKVTITTNSADAKINIGAVDVGSTSPRTLGLTNDELDRITAGNLVIGDASNTGGITVSAATTTLAKTGNLTLQTGGNIAVNAALTVGDAAGTKNLTLDAGGAITNGANGKLTATNLTLKAGSTIGADGAAIKTNVTTANLTSADYQFLVEDNLVTVAAKSTSGAINITTNNGTMTVGSVNGVSGIDAGTGNVGLTANSGSGHGIHMSSDVKGKDITVNATANNGTGLGFYGAGGSFTASGTLKLTGTATGTGNGFYSYGGTHSAQTGINITGTSEKGQGVGFDRNVVITNASNNIVITGTSNGTGTNPEAIGLRGSSITNTNGNIKLVATKGNVFTNSEGGTPGQYWGLPGPLTNTITNNGTGEIQILAGSTKTDTGAIDGKVLTIHQNGNGGVLVKTTGNGNVIAPKITNAGTGNVVIAAGSLKDAGDGSGGGQVLTSSSSPVTQNSTGKTLIYSGNAAGSGVLSNLDSTLGALKVDGTAAQNADTNAAFGAGTGISGSTAKAQAIFREKLTVAADVVADATLVKTYGDESTKNTSAAALLAEAKGALKNAAANSDNNSTFTTGEQGDNNRIVVSKSVVVGSLTGPSALTNGSNSLATSDFSFAGFLMAKQGAYQFKNLTSDKFTVTGVDVAVNVNQRALSGSVSAVSTTYGTTAATGSASVIGVIGNDRVETSVSGAVLTGTQSSTSGSLRVGTYTQTAAIRVTGGADGANYTSGTASSFNYGVTPKEVTATATAADKVYDGNTSATLVASGVGIVGADVVTVQGLTGNFASKNVARDGSGNVVAQEVIITGTGSSLGGTDGANYTLVGNTSVPAASARITPKTLSLVGITAADKVYDGTTTAQLSAAKAVLTGLVAGDSVNVSAQNAQGNFIDKNVARGANGQPFAKQVLVSGLALTGAEQGNYQLGSSADVAATITPRPVSLSGSTALDKVVDTTTTAQVQPGTLSNLVAGEQLGVNSSGEFEDALVGTNKLVNARFALVNGANGLASNYELANTTAQLRAAIVAFIPGAVTAGSGPQGAGSASGRIRFAGASGVGAATGVSDEPVTAEVLEQCSVLNPEKCECEDTTIAGVQMCFAPNSTVSLKDR